MMIYCPVRMGMFKLLYVGLCLWSRQNVNVIEIVVMVITLS